MYLYSADQTGQLGISTVDSCQSSLDSCLWSGGGGGSDSQQDSENSLQDGVRRFRSHPAINPRLNAQLSTFVMWCFFLPAEK
jgi:hypothetical protein